MANRKLSPPLFSEKATFLLANASTQYLHFISGAHRKDQFSLVCESQPLMTFGGHGLPARCPACGALMTSGLRDSTDDPRIADRGHS